MTKLDINLKNWIMQEIEEYCNTVETLYVYDVTSFRVNKALDIDEWYVSDLKELDGYVATIVDCEFVVSDIRVDDLEPILVYKNN